MIKKLIVLQIIALLALTSCNKSKLTEADLPSNQKLLSVCVTPWDKTVLDNTRIISFESDIARCGSECVPVEFECKEGSFTALKRDNAEIPAGSALPDIANTKPTCAKEAKCSCVLPDAKGVVSDGVTFQAFSASNAACGQACASKKIDMLCQNGAFVDPISKAALGAYSFSCDPIECKSCTSGWDPRLQAAHGGSVTGYINSSLQCGKSCLDPAANSVKFNCADGVLTREVGALATAEASLKTSCQVDTNCNCRTADANTFSHSDATILKLTLKSAGTCASPCDAPIDYKCLSGSFVKTSDSTKQTAPVYQTCKDACIYCALPDGTKIQQGNQATIYKGSIGTCDKACERLVVRCDVVNQQGVLAIVSGVGPIDDYKAPACSETCVTCNLPDGSKLQENKSAALFTTTSAGCGQSCNSGTVMCDKATATLTLASGTSTVSSYKYNTCANTCVQCALPDGGLINEYEVATRYSAETGACGEMCYLKRRAQMQCVKGQLVFWPFPYPGTPADYKYAACNDAPCKSCTLPWQTSSSIPNGFTAFRFGKVLAECGERCSELKVDMLCKDSVLQITSGNAQTNLATSVASCSQKTCPQCNFNGRVLSEGETAMAYKNDGSSCAVGVCADYIKLTCSNGVMTGGDLAVYKFGACQSACVAVVKTEVGRAGDNSLEGGGAFPWFCPMLHSKGFAWGGTKLTYYTKSSVACADSCNNYKVTVECNNLSGLFSNSNRMLYMQCQENCN